MACCRVSVPSHSADSEMRYPAGDSGGKGTVDGDMMNFKMMRQMLEIGDGGNEENQIN